MAKNVADVVELLWIQSPMSTTSSITPTWSALEGCILSTPRGGLRTTKSSYTPSLLRDDCDGVREVLSKSRINAKMHESQGFLPLPQLLLMDSYKMMMYLHVQYENELLFNRL
jgi:hypothetical protein